MYVFAPPSPVLLRDHRLSVSDSEFTYEDVELTRAWPCPAVDWGHSGEVHRDVRGPLGYVFGGASAVVGHGLDDYRAAVEALRAWSMFPQARARLESRDAPIAAGVNVAIGLRGVGFWAVCGCRIVCVFEDPDQQAADGSRCYGFAYGTLPSHVTQGEERFLVGYDAATEKVWYEICSFSRPQGRLANLGKPLMCYLQQTFRRDSIEAMSQGVRSYRDRAAATEPPSQAELLAS